VADRLSSGPWLRTSDISLVAVFDVRGNAHLKRAHGAAAYGRPEGDPPVKITGPLATLGR